MPDIQLDYAVPDADLADYITLFYLFWADVPMFEDTERADHAQIRFRLNPQGAEYRFPDGTIQRAEGIHLIGPTTGAVRVRAEGPVRVFGAGITPAGWSALVGNDASAMINRVIDATELFGGRLTRVIPELAAAPDIATMVPIASKLLRELIRTSDGESLAFIRQVDGWLASSPSPQIDDLIVITGLSRRQVERKCNALYGTPPKLLARKYRALRAAVALLSENTSLDDVIERGFYDQSHLIREIKQFTGLTPRQIKADPPVLARLTMAQRHALGGQVGPLISDT
ncbi:AraC family transcriptional regulator [Sphingomonas koreensis]|nr:AraC family transcriptional regulator [Sphingomonas koreensis]